MIETRFSTSLHAFPKSDGEPAILLELLKEKFDANLKNTEMCHLRIF